jgi:hypothetical protein
MAIAMQQPP